MGNSSSSSDSDDDAHIDYKTQVDDEDASDGESTDKDGNNVDLGTLFSHTTLRTAAARIKDDMPENVLQQHYLSIINWLEERLQRGEENVTLGQFYDQLINRSVEREDCVQAFQQFDSEGDGTADVATMLEGLRALATNNVFGELAYVVRTLQAGTLTPGFMDVYNENKEALDKHGARILNFLLRNRAASHLLPYPILNGFNNTSQMRLAAANSIFSKLKEQSNTQEEENMLVGGEELHSITKCFSSLEVSTNKADASRLLNGEFSSYWQSDGSARSHWIRLHMKSGVVIKQLSVSVAAADQSYMPQLITVSVGKYSHRLREIKETRIPGHITGDVILLENVKVFYPIIQINVKRCHSDGCDVRIHCVKTLGYRVVKESSISVMDASAAWYLQVLASTTTACLPIAPQLRSAVLQHTKDALNHMPPLSLSPASSERPALLSPHVLKQMDRFLQDIAVSEHEVDREGLQVLLGFNLARGHVAGTIRTLQLLQEKKDTELDSLSLLKSLVVVQNNFWKKQGSLLQLTLEACDGGQKEETSSPSNVLSGAWTSSQPYLTGDNKTKVNMFFKGPDHIQLTKLRIKVEKGSRGPRKGLVFVFQEDNPFKLEEQVTRFEGYDKWGPIEYSFVNKVRAAGIGGKPDNPVGYFMVEDDWDEIEVTLDVCPVGKYVLVKFLEPRGLSAERLGIVGVKFYGFHRKNLFTHDYDVEKVAPIGEKTGTVSGDVVCIRTLSFLTYLARDQSPPQKAILSNRTQTLDMADVSVELLWKLYKGFENRGCQNLCLQLLHTLFPFLPNSKENSQEAAESLFGHLCAVVDKAADNKDDQSDHRLVSVARQTIIDGAAVFFPDKSARRKQLFTMMANGNSSTEAPSVSLTFQSLCQFFSSVDPSGLLDLPPTPTEDLNTEPVLGVMETLVSVAHREFQKILDTVDVTDQSVHLVQLLCSLQTSLLSWCQRQIECENKQHGQIAQALLLKYVSLLAEKATAACAQYQKNCEEWMINLMSKLESSFLCTVLRQLVLVLTMLSTELSSNIRVRLLKTMMPILQELKKISLQLTQFFYKVDSEAWQKMESGEVVLRSWEVESTHNYENNQHHTQTFTCPGASLFIVDFDPRCETEKRYDYLEFTDSRGVKTRYDHKVGTDKWPGLMTFRGGHKLQFLFHSDTSNNEWGYKFKVLAKGCPDMPLCWMFDLYQGMSKLFGRLCGATLDASQVMPKVRTPSNNNSPEDAEQDMLKSELWTTLFRGGYMVGKLQRSLSGKHVAVDDSRARTFLLTMVEESEGLPAKFLQKCQETAGNPSVGGEEVSNAVTSVFAALIWHTQSLRDDLDRYGQSVIPEHTEDPKYQGESRIGEGLQQAYNTAEGLRMHLIDQRQKYKVTTEQAAAASAAVDPVTACREKALFLLKFAGLSKVHLKTESKQKLDRRSSKNLNRLQSVTTDRNFKMDSALEKYPSFRLVLDFVRDPAWSKQRVEELLKQRSLQAQAVAEVCVFTSEFIRTTTDGHIFQIPTVLFLRDLLAHQNKFPKHYADGLEGCGLDLEAQVRGAYYTLIRRVVESIRAVKRLELPKSVLSTYDFVQACALHLLDMDWQLYDLSFLNDIKLPEFYMQLAKENVAMREKIVSKQNEEEELKNYEKHMKWLEECKKGFVNWYDSHTEMSVPREDKKAVQMLVAQFCDLLEVEITCDGCGATLPGRRYRCLSCQDMDLCATCYAGGVKPGGEHTDDHDMIHLMYKCDECKAFIVGTRIHCKVCEDFDLCLGCQNAGHFPSVHSSEHDVKKFPMIRLHLNKEVDSSLLSYTHQHAWLLFSSLSLTMSNILYNPSQAAVQPDTDYIKAATDLHRSCIELVNAPLMLGTSCDDIEDDDSAEVLTRRQEEAFAVHSQERIMGLLGAMIPQDDKVPLAEDVSCIFGSEDFLKLLFAIARGDLGHEETTQHYAMGLIGQLLQKSTIDCKNVDAAVSSVAPEMTVCKDKQDGYLATSFLFDFGATCLERSGLEWAHSMASILQKLFNCPAWRTVLLTHMSESISNLKKNPELSSIFALFVIAGFPEVFSTGSQVKYMKLGTEMKNGVVLKHFPDKNQSLLVDMKTRRRFTLNDELLECVCYDIQVLDKENICTLVEVILDIGTMNKTDAALTVERVWVLSLCLKALLKTLQAGGAETLSELFQSKFVRCVVNLAAQGTGFYRQWLLRDLEVLSLMLYTRDREEKAKDEQDDEESEKPTSPKKTDDSAEAAAAEASASASSSPSSSSSSPSAAAATAAAAAPEEKKGENPLKGLDDVTKQCFVTIHKHLHISYPVLRAIYDMTGSSTKALLMTVHENLEGEFTPTEEMIKLSKKWSYDTSSVVVEGVADKTIDTGMQFIASPPKEPKSRSYDKATEEPSDDCQKLISAVDNDAKNDAVKQRRAKSSTLLKKELDQHGKTAPRHFLFKVNMGMTVLYARQLLTTLLAEWPVAGHQISSDLIGCKDNSQVPFVLDLLNTPEAKGTFQKVVQNLIKHSDSASLVPIALTCSQFMEESNLLTISKESEHNYKEDTEEEGKVHIPGAHYLMVEFDSRCSIEEALAHLTLSSSQDYKQNKHYFSGGHEKWTDFEIPGDTLYFEFTSDADSTTTEWGYKFTVTGGKIGRFDTGCIILKEVLSDPKVVQLLPQAELWKSLVYVACKHTGQQRLKTIQLLLQLMQAQFRNRGASKLALDLGLLKALWKLYNKMSKSTPECGNILPAILRALTELFLVAETLAEDWDMSSQYVASLMDYEDVHKTVFQGLQNVAALSAAMGLTNKATQGFKALHTTLGEDKQKLALVWPRLGSPPPSSPAKVLSQVITS